MAKETPISMRLSSKLKEQIHKEASRRSNSTSKVIESLLEEGIRMRSCPGIIFTEGAAGRRATIAGTGIDVWEIVRAYISCKKDLAKLSATLPQLSIPQFESALFYYRLYRDEINARLGIEEEAVQELANSPFVKQFKT